MYDLAAVKRKIRKEGVQKVIDLLLSDNLSDNVRNQLTDCGVITNGYPNLSLIYSLA